MSFGIAKIGTYIPSLRQKIDEVLEYSGCNEREIKLMKRLHNIHQVPIVENGQRLEETLRYALLDLHLDIKVDLVLYAHSLLAQVPHDYGLLNKVLMPFDLLSTKKFGIAQEACASSFYAMELADLYFAKKKNVNTILLILGDQSNMTTRLRYIENSTVIGDSAVAVLLQKKNETNKVLSIGVYRDTRFNQGFYENPQKTALFNEEYVSIIIKAIHETLTKANVVLDEIQYILPYNVNKMTWRKFSKLTHFPLENIILDLLPEIGHTYTTDCFINLDYLQSQNRLKKGDKILMVSVGLGCFVGSAVIEH
ncbi:3-oxoacyl-[acyl-carrier-protein] synthase III C-terminal domain-containing protein [Viridibacillus sp. FSL R5-0477]|uniref:3-oxoacyl-ACP synthase n=1 Tax=Viridibacillus arenosi FSL R5-213 TaxID=1227360 RepID=W4F3J7_9BACL|nr:MULTISPECIES: 3-oxoacyl-[acyl-carrier-protein] synthase III C-terminal domain-containing protein [Viridibacillus]ETT86892.1 hypothetical protein C176_09267 [Viridibacillus arenosi FSL R5-213]OMC83156.1 hypothetical protein BK128_18730 [Viridibacillus sp. FSL H7-0596]OMC83258.1 hypothetical protein BK130_06830 [Viridibacillus sp. FSL H8-0123]OMC88169.1 hypothetical protein BK137_19070 [Viridibacillus arenosi]